VSRKYIVFWCLVVVSLIGSAVLPGFGMAAQADLASILEDTAASGRFDVYHWWTAGGEKEAIDSAIAEFQKRYPDLRVVSNAIPGGAGGAMVMKVKVLALTGNSPETFQAHPGLELQPYLDAGMLYDLTDLWDYADIEERLLSGIAELCQVDGRYYIVPMGVHKTNMIYYNKRLFDEYGITSPSEPVTWDEFWSLCDELKQKLPAGKYPLDLGDRKGWPATHVFETLMIGTDPQIYEDFVNGKATEEQVQEVLDRFKRFMSYVAPDHSARLWYEAAGRVVAGDYAMMLQGSWIQAFFTSQGWTYGEDFCAFAAPGTSEYFGFCVDAFVVPQGSRSVANGLRWAYMISDPGTQEAFSRAKESVSPYVDTPDEIYDELTRRFKGELMDPQTMVYPSFTHGTSLPWEATTDLHSRISDFATSSNPDTARYARMITQAIKEAGVRGEWDIVK